MKSSKRQTGLLAGSVIVAGSFGAGAAFADLYHYSNLLQGDRAQGLGGAYTAIADDASGLVYNPAGLAFALSNDISGSVNAFYSREAVYKDVIGDEPFTEKSGGSVAPFFGVLQKLDKYVPGMVGAFGNYYTDSDLKDQDDLLENKDLGGAELRRFHRSVTHRASTNYWSAAVGYRVTPSFALGFGLSYFSVDELTQEYQDVQQQKLGVFSNGDDGWLIRSTNTTRRLTVHGLEPSLGAQFVVANQFAFGLVVKSGMVVSQNLQVDAETHDLIVTDDGFATLETGGQTQGIGSQANVRNKEDNPIGGWPMQARFGFAWFASTRFLLSMDAAYYGKVDDAEVELYNREAITNYHLGTEYYIMPSFPLRFGLFTNNDARPEVKDDETDQPDHVDYIGESLFIAWVQPNSQIALGAVLQQGKGESQKIGGSTTVHDVEATSQTFAFSATHNF